MDTKIKGKLMNNDRLKFRVWSGKEFKYSGGHFLVDQDGVLFCRNKKNPDILIKLGNHGCFEQCTGLRDKNGNLIYEGDIVIDHGDPQYKSDLMVKWSERTCGFYFDSDKIGMRNHLTTIDCAESHNYEIIGNIHEQK